MNNLKKVGLTALGTALVASSAQAADFSMSATSQITLAGADNGNKGNGFSMSDSISFSASGEMDNGFTVTHSIELDGGMGVGFNALAIDTGDMGKLTFVGGSSTSVMGVWDDLTPSANEESWGVGYAGTPDTPANGSAITHNIFTYDYTVSMNGNNWYYISGWQNTDGSAGQWEYYFDYTNIPGGASLSNWAINFEWQNNNGNYNYEMDYDFGNSNTSVTMNVNTNNGSGNYSYFTPSNNLMYDYTWSNNGNNGTFTSYVTNPPQIYTWP